MQIGTERQFITDFALFPNPTDTLTTIPFLESFHVRCSRFLQKAAADSGYGSEENYRFMEENGMEAFVKYNRSHKEMRRPFRDDAFRADNLYYNVSWDYFVCPMGQRMDRCGTVHGRTAGGYPTETTKYRAARCEGSPLRGQCFKAKAGNRTIEVNHRLREYKRKARERLNSEEGLVHRSRRPIEPEAVSGQMKYDMGYKRFRYFGLEKVLMDFAFFAIAFNLKKMCTQISGVYWRKLRKPSGHIVLGRILSRNGHETLMKMIEPMKMAA